MTHNLFSSSSTNTEEGNVERKGGRKEGQREEKKEGRVDTQQVEINQGKRPKARAFHLRLF